MPRVIGIDPGTVTVDLCGLEHGQVFLDRSVPTAEALADPDGFVALLAGAGRLDCIAGPSGYGLPLTPAQQATEEDLRLALLDGGGAVRAGSGARSLLFGGGAAAIAGWDGGPGSPDALGNPRTPREKIALDAFVESAVKAIRFRRASVPAPREIVLSGRLARVEGVRRAITQRLEGISPVRLLEGFAAQAKQGAQGAALIADGLSRGRHRELVAALGIREAQGTVLDHLYVISREQARRRLGLE